MFTVQQLWKFLNATFVHGPKIQHWSELLTIMFSHNSAMFTLLNWIMLDWAVAVRSIVSVVPLQFSAKLLPWKNPNGKGIWASCFFGEGWTHTCKVGFACWWKCWWSGWWISEGDLVTQQNEYVGYWCHKYMNYGTAQASIIPGYKCLFNLMFKLIIDKWQSRVRLILLVHIPISVFICCLTCIYLHFACPHCDTPLYFSYQVLYLKHNNGTKLLSKSMANCEFWNLLSSFHFSCETLYIKTVFIWHLHKFKRFVCCMFAELPN